MAASQATEELQRYGAIDFVLTVNLTLWRSTLKMVTMTIVETCIIPWLQSVWYVCSLSRIGVRSGEGGQHLLPFSPFGQNICCFWAKCTIFSGKHTQQFQNFRLKCCWPQFEEVACFHRELSAHTRLILFILCTSPLIFIFVAVYFWFLPSWEK